MSCIKNYWIMTPKLNLNPSYALIGAKKSADCFHFGIDQLVIVY